MAVAAATWLFVGPVGHGSILAVHVQARTGYYIDQSSGITLMRKFLMRKLMNAKTRARKL
jgi:hypothetical protein